MKTKLYLMILLMAINLAVFAQLNDSKADEPSVLIPSAKVTGWFLSTTTSFSEIQGNQVWMPGLGGGIKLNNNVYLGFQVKSLSIHEQQLRFDSLLSEPAFLVGGYGGLYFEAGTNLNQLIHLTIPITIGAGGAEYISVNEYNEIDDNEWDTQRKHLASSAFFVIEPGINIEVNVLKFMKVFGGYSYRWTTGLNLDKTDNKVFNASNYNLGLRFGRF